MIFTSPRSTLLSARPLAALAVLLGLVLLPVMAWAEPIRSDQDRSLAPQRVSTWPEAEREESLPSIDSSARGGGIVTVGAGAACDYASLNDAINNADSGDTIRVSDTGDYLGDTYTIINFDGELTISGGFPDCSSTQSAGRTVLDADASGRVFYIEMNSSFSGSTMRVVLENVEIINGNNSGSFGGGGLLINGQPGVLDVELRNVVVRDNHSSTRGGGIHLRVNDDRSAAGTMLTMDNSSELRGNSSDGHGGGLACSSLGSVLDTATLARLGATAIRMNSAQDGAGIFVDGCKRVFLYAGYDVSLAGSVVDNDAAGNGGGIAVVNGGEMLVRGDSFGSFGVDTGAAEILSNSANIGGGAYVANDGSYLFLGDAVIRNNSAAVRGGGIAISLQGRVRMRRLQDEPCQEPGPSGNPRCSKLENNQVGASTTAIAVNVFSGGELEMYRTEIVDHAGGGANRLIALDSNIINPPEAAAVTAVFEGVAIHGNSGLNTVITANNLADLTFGWGTITANDAGNVVRTGSGDSEIDIYSSIIWEDSGKVFERAGDGEITAVLNCVIGHQATGDLEFDSSNSYSQIDPEFIDATNGNLRLGPTSPAIDYCDDFNAPQYPGLDGTARGFVHRGEPLTQPPTSANGDFDLGAFEMTYVTDQIFNDRFEQE